MPNFRLVTLLALAACIQSRGLGPDLGPCSEPPDGPHTFGQIGIGSCLASPTDIQFFELDGTTWLAVANGDTYYNFTSGSVLFIDWDSIDMSKPEQPMHELRAYSTPTDRFLGQLGMVHDRPDGTRLLLVPTRESPEMAMQNYVDDLLIFDATDPTRIEPWSEGDRLAAGQNPYHIQITDGKAFVLNLSGRDIAVFDTHSTPIEPWVLRDQARIERPRFLDHAQTGARAELAAWDVVFDQRVPGDRWTLTWRDHSYRVWVPTDQGFFRWSGGDSALVPAPTGPDVPSALFSGPVTGAFAYTFELEGATVPSLAFAADGNLFSASAISNLSSWALDDDVLLRGDPRGGWAARLDNPSRFQLGTFTGIAFDARPEPDAPAAIGMAVRTEGFSYERLPDPVLLPDEGVSFEAPIVRRDPYTGGPRMWLTVREGASSYIAQSVGTGPTDFSSPTAVEGLPPGAAHPVVTLVNNRYRMWFVTYEDDQWWLNRAWSFDGLSWHDPELLRPMPEAFDPISPPRPAVQAEPIGGFAVESADLGRITLPSIFARDGDGFDAVERAGLRFRVATGHALGLDNLPSTFANGVEPGSAADLPSGRTLYATAHGADGRRHIALISVEAGEPLVIEYDLFDLDALEISSAFSPVVRRVEDRWLMVFGGVTLAGRPVVLRATSVDGLSWDLHDEPVFTTVPEFATVEVAPGSLQQLPGGGLRMWYGGFDGTRWRIGSATSANGGQDFDSEPAPDGRTFQLGPGVPGTFDDVSVRSPRFFQLDGETYLAYAGFNGREWRLGLAQAIPRDGPANGELQRWQRRVDFDGRATPWLGAISGSFASAGVDSPLPIPLSDGTLQVWFAGHDRPDVTVPRLGVAHGTPHGIFPEIRAPRAGDQMTFQTVAGGDPTRSIRLEQILDGMTTDGTGAHSMTLDEDRGFMYVTARNQPFVYVIDVRDDSTRGQRDANYLDLEALVQIRRPHPSLRDAVPLPGTDRLYASGRQPDGVFVLDISELEDLPNKRIIRDTLMHVFPVRVEERDINPFFDPFAFQTPTTTNLAGLTVRQHDGRSHLFAAHFSDDSLLTFDLDRGAYGAQVQAYSALGERPFVVRISPDQRYAAVASYLGDVDDGFVSATIAIFDVDPSSPTFGEVVTTLVNR